MLRRAALLATPWPRPERNRPMNCHDFHRAWNELLDVRPGGAEAAADPTADILLDDRLRATREHSRDCSDCRRAQVGYEALKQSLAAWRLAPPASARPS